MAARRCVLLRCFGQYGDPDRAEARRPGHQSDHASRRPDRLGGPDPHPPPHRRRGGRRLFVQLADRSVREPGGQPDGPRAAGRSLRQTRPPAAQILRYPFPRRHHQPVFQRYRRDFGRPQPGNRAVGFGCTDGTALSRVHAVPQPARHPGGGVCHAALLFGRVCDHPLRQPPFPGTEPGARPSGRLCRGDDHRAADGEGVRI